MKRTPRPKPKSRISRITIARLYNIGNYEHVRYELTADVPEGNSAKIAVAKLVKILRGANPKPPHSRFEYERAKESISKPLSKMDEMDHANQRAYRRVVDDVNRWKKQREEALDLLHKFGGTADHRDAKLEWDDIPF